MATSVPRPRMLHRHLRTFGSLWGAARDGMGTSSDDAGGGGGGGSNPEGNSEKDHYDDGEGKNGGRHYGGNNANGNSGVDTGNDSASKGSTESVEDLSLESDLLTTSASINTENVSSSSSSTLHSNSSFSSPTTRVSVSSIGVATFSSATPSSNTPAKSTNFITSQSNISKHSNYGAIAGGVVGAFAVVLFVLAAWIIYKRSYKNRPLPHDEFVNNSASYPFAHVGLSNGEEKNEMMGGNYDSKGTSPAGQAKFKPSFVDPAQGVLSEKRSQPGEYREYRDVSFTQLLPASQPEVLYATSTRISTSPSFPVVGSMPGTPTTPNGRRVPFGTGTFQFPVRPPQSQMPGQGNPL